MTTQILQIAKPTVAHFARASGWTRHRQVLIFKFFLWSLNCVAVCPTNFRSGTWQGSGTDRSDLFPCPTISEQIPELLPVETYPTQLILEFPDDFVFSIPIEDYYHILS
jgi:hypothetical protein